MTRLIAMAAGAALVLAACGGGAPVADELDAPDDVAQVSPDDELGDADPSDAAGVYSLELTGDASLRSSGFADCTGFDGELSVEFYEESDVADSFYFRIDASGVDGDGTYHGDVDLMVQGELEPEDAHGSVTIEIAFADSQFGEVASARFSGAYDGQPGSGEINGDFSCPSGAWHAAGGDDSGAGDAAGGPRQAVLAYTVGGDASVSGEEIALHVCSISSSEGIFLLESIGDVAFRVEADGSEPGQHQARIELYLLESPGAQGEPSRATGAGTLGFEDDGGPDPVLGWDWISGSFSGQDLTSPQGNTFSVEGSFSCPLMTHQ